MKTLDLTSEVKVSGEIWPILSVFNDLHSPGTENTASGVPFRCERDADIESDLRSRLAVEFSASELVSLDELNQGLFPAVNNMVTKQPSLEVRAIC